MNYVLDMQDTAVLLEHYRMKVLAYTRMTQLTLIQEREANRCLRNITALIELARHHGWTWMLENEEEVCA